MHLAEKLIRENLKTKSTYLDLGNCGLDGTEPFLELLAEAEHLEWLNFSATWRAYLTFTKKWEIRHSRNSSRSNHLKMIPNKLPKKLKTLTMRGEENDIWDIEDLTAIIHISELGWLDVSYNRIDKVAPLVHLYNLRQLRISGNNVSDFPSNLLMGGVLFSSDVERLLDFFNSTANQDVQKQLNEAKLIMVGIGEVGKTELVEALSEPDYVFVEGRKTTKGIRIKTWKPECRRAGEAVPDFRINVWDFAGQEINYGTHQYFLTKSSLYVFVWETRKDNENTGFEYWLNVVSLLSDNAPILVVQNKTDIYKLEINQRNWKERFPNIVGFYKTSCKDNIGIKELSAVIRDEITKLKHTHEIWNKDRYAIRKMLEQDTRNYISQSDYFDICENKVKDKNNKGLSRDQALYLSDQLHNIGVILHFQNDFKLKDTIVLKPEWATKASYLLSDNKRNTKEGYFGETDLDTIWQEKGFEDKHNFLLNLMLKFELIFNLQGTPQYIVPELLPIDEKAESEKLATDFDLTFEYHYDFMPKSILSRFTCRNATYIAGEHFWKYGVWLRDDDVLAKLESNDVSKYIRVRLVGGKRVEQLLYLIRRDIGLIHQDLRNPPVQEVVPCPCSQCKTVKRTEKHFFKFKTLQKFKEEGDKHIRCEKSAEKQSIDSLLQGIKTTPQADIDSLLHFIEKAQIDKFFELVRKLDIQNSQFHKLENEFVGGQSERDSNYIQRLRVWVRSL